MGELHDDRCSLKCGYHATDDPACSLSALRAARAELLLQLSKAEKLKQGYYDEAAEGWKKFRASELQVGEYRRFCEGIVASTETDLTFWRRRAQFCLDAMKNPKREECPHLTFEESGICHECTKKRNHESALGPEMTPMERILMEAVNEFCSCGGAGPEDGCTVCKIWHRYVARSRKV